jgi:hypothetical protein
MQTPDQTNAGKPGDLKHPAQEEWMSWLYGEAPRADRVRLAAHLRECPACQARMDQWSAAKSALDDWQLPEVGLPKPARPVTKWAAAAALMLGLGTGFAAAEHLAASARAADLAALRAEMQAEVRNDLAQQRRQFMAEVLKAVDDRRAEDARGTLAALREINDAHRGDYDALHKELETMAVLTQTGFQEAQEQIVGLAGASVPSGTKITR